VLWTGAVQYSLQAGWSENRILVGVRFFVAIQHCVCLVPGRLTGVKRPGCGIDHQPPSSTKVKKVQHVRLLCWVSRPIEDTNIMPAPKPQYPQISLHCPIILTTEHVNLNILLFPCIVSLFIAKQQHAQIRQKSVPYYCTLHFSRSK
jgi:hypothetical protein